MACSILFHFHMNALTFSWEIVELSDINYHLIGVLSPLETPVSLVTDYSKYLRIVAGGISN